MHEAEPVGHRCGECFAGQRIPSKKRFACLAQEKGCDDRRNQTEPGLAERKHRIFRRDDDIADRH